MGHVQALESLLGLGRQPSGRPIVADTEETARRRAEEIRSATARRVADAKNAQVQGVQVPTRGARLVGFRLPEVIAALAARAPTMTGRVSIAKVYLTNCFYLN